MIRFQRCKFSEMALTCSTWLIVGNKSNPFAFILALIHVQHSVNQSLKVWIANLLET